MKTCPICHAVTFDDAEVCFGCMYRFEDEQEGPPAPAIAIAAGALPEFRIRFTPMQEPSGSLTWSCAIES